MVVQFAHVERRSGDADDDGPHLDMLGEDRRGGFALLNVGLIDEDNIRVVHVPLPGF